MFETRNLLVETGCRDLLGIAKLLSDKTGRVERESVACEDFRLLVIRPELKHVLVLK